MFLQSFFMGKDSVPATSVSIQNVNNIKLENGRFECLYCSTNTSLDQYDNGMPEWEGMINENGISTDVTVLRTDFDNTCNASSLGFDVNNVSKMRIKRREKIPGSKFQTIYEHPVASSEDLKFTFEDKIAANGKTYEYTLVPVIEESEMNLTELDINIKESVESKFDGIYIYDGENYYCTKMNMSSSYQRNTVSNTITTITNKYAYVVQNGNADYATGDVSGVFIEYTEEDGFDYEHGVEYRNTIYDSLNNGNPKIIKFYDGRILMAMVTDVVSEDSGEGWKIPSSQISYTEIGDPTDYEDLKNYGFIEVG